MEPGAGRDLTGPFQLCPDELTRVCETTTEVSPPCSGLIERRAGPQGLYQDESRTVRELRDLTAALDEVLPDRFAALARARRYVGSTPSQAWNS